MRRQPPASVRMHTGDDFNYSELIGGDTHGFSHVLLGIFDPLATHTAAATRKLYDSDRDGFHAILAPTVSLARHIFRAPTQHYKTGVALLIWLNDHQDHFTMLGGAQAIRSLPYIEDTFKLADTCSALSKTDIVVDRMQQLLKSHGV
ncbi:MAG: hypothetical protein ACI9XK_004492 [Granulosicoccus sp.]|jgi:hypothetical protein